MSQTHELKTLPQFYDAVARGEKQFELRKDDRGFEVGDTLLLRRYGIVTLEPRTMGYDGQQVAKCIVYILRDVPQFGLAPGFCILGLGEVNP